MLGDACSWGGTDKRPHLLHMPNLPVSHCITVSSNRNCGPFYSPSEENITLPVCGCDSSGVLYGHMLAEWTTGRLRHRSEAVLHHHWGVFITQFICCVSACETVYTPSLRYHLCNQEEDDDDDGWSSLSLSSPPVIWPQLLQTIKDTSESEVNWSDLKWPECQGTNTKWCVKSSRGLTVPSQSDDRMKQLIQVWGERSNKLYLLPGLFPVAEKTEAWNILICFQQLQEFNWTWSQKWWLIRRVIIRPRVCLYNIKIFLARKQGTKVDYSLKYSSRAGIKRAQVISNVSSTQKLIYPATAELYFLFTCLLSFHLFTSSICCPLETCLFVFRAVKIFPDWIYWWALPGCCSSSQLLLLLLLLYSISGSVKTYNTHRPDCAATSWPHGAADCWIQSEEYTW